MGGGCVCANTSNTSKGTQKVPQNMLFEIQEGKHTLQEPPFEGTPIKWKMDGNGSL